jgi:hypothetical protein
MGGFRELLITDSQVLTSSSLLLQPKSPQPGHTTALISLERINKDPRTTDLTPKATPDTALQSPEHEWRPQSEISQLQ